MTQFAVSGIALVIALVLSAAPVRADESEQQPAQAAEALFLEGRKLLANGQTEEACRSFEESRRLEPAIGTTMNLARCYLKLGRTASAWLLYRDTAASARALGQLDREAHARRELAAIEPDLARVVIDAEADLLRDRRVQVLLDGSLIPGALLGSAVPVDPGAHQIAVRTPHAELWTGQVQVAARQTEEVSIPHLEVPPDPPLPAAAPEAAGGEQRDAAPVRPAHWLTPRRKVALAFAGVAAASAGYALFETVRAANANDRSDPDTCKVGMTCTRSALYYRERAFDSAQRANIAVGISGACLVGAGILWVLGAPPEQQISVGNVGSAWTVGYRNSW